MAKTNYNKISTEPILETENQIEPEIEDVEAIEEIEPQPIIGVVIGCKKLNVRKNPVLTSDIVCVVDVGSELMIDMDESTDEWFKVCTPVGSEGFCMRQFVGLQ